MGGCSICERASVCVRVVYLVVVFIFAVAFVVSHLINCVYKKEMNCHVHSFIRRRRHHRHRCLGRSRLLVVVIVVSHTNCAVVKMLLMLLPLLELFIQGWLLLLLLSLSTSSSSLSSIIPIYPSVHPSIHTFARNHSMRRLLVLVGYCCSRWVFVRWRHLVQCPSMYSFIFVCACVRVNVVSSGCMSSSVYLLGFEHFILNPSNEKRNQMKSEVAATVASAAVSSETFMDGGIPNAQRASERVSE